METLKLEARLLVIEYMLQRLYMETYRANEMTPDQILHSHQNIREQVRREKWPMKDPGLSALASGEVEDAFGDFLNALESMLAEKGLLPKV